MVHPGGGDNGGRPARSGLGPGGRAGDLPCTSAARLAATPPARSGTRGRQSKPRAHPGEYPRLHGHPQQALTGGRRARRESGRDGQDSQSADRERTPRNPVFCVREISPARRGQGPRGDLGRGSATRQDGRARGGAQDLFRGYLDPNGSIAMREQHYRSRKSGRRTS